MGVVSRYYGQSPAGGSFLRNDTGNYPSGRENFYPMSPSWSDPTRDLPLPLTENTGALIESYRTGRFVWIYQDISSLTAQQPLSAVYMQPPAYLQPLGGIYANIGMSYGLGGKS